MLGLRKVGAHAAAPWRTFHCLLVAALFVCISAVPIKAQPAVDLLLVLAVDTSGSVDMPRFELQRRGYAQAFRHPQVLKAIRTGPAQAIAVTMTQWTGPHLQEHVVGWTRLHDEASTAAFARAIDAAPRRLFGGGTSISGAIDHALTLFPASPFPAPRHIIDISGDGANNRGRPAETARDEAVAAGAVINGLPILALEPMLDIFYQRNVIGGPGAFMVPADSYESFGDAILKKLILEIAAAPVARGRYASTERP